jgi:hypothetical protein
MKKSFLLLLAAWSNLTLPQIHRITPTPHSIDPAPLKKELTRLEKERAIVLKRQTLCKYVALISTYVMAISGLRLLQVNTIADKSFYDEDDVHILQDTARSTIVRDLCGAGALSIALADVPASVHFFSQAHIAQRLIKEQEEKITGIDVRFDMSDCHEALAAISVEALPWASAAAILASLLAFMYQGKTLEIINERIKVKQLELAWALEHVSVPQPEITV